ncbi:Glycosyltransferase [Polaribacter irgensii 23-P]|uniref:Glycosyltransferase n=1 Tax=Polaribacter irgensii 23-P TaxID=313594 RepID=A4C1F4_9FLAO|nr:glycosyltransferase [Polaribacter irgensii]EAR11957.1 Glycosyltransferase [Polaribacter irgensii 23-P]
MKLAILTAYPPSKVTLNEYAYHLVKEFRQKSEITELILLTDITKKPKTMDFLEEGCKITIKECWSFNSYRNILTVVRAIKETQPDSIFFNLQFMKFGDRKIPAALGLLLPFICTLKRIPTVVLLHNILEEVDLKKAGITSNKLLQTAYHFIGSLLMRMLLKADVVAVTMKKYVGVLEKKYNVKNVIAVPHGTFEVPTKPKFKLPKGALKIMTFGKFGTYKKVELLIEAVQIVRGLTGMDLEIVIAGANHPSAPLYLENVKQKFADVSKLTFMGYVEEDKIPILFNESAVVVFPYSSTTGSSGVLHQAGSYGKAVIMPNLGDLALLVKEEGYRAEFFEPNNAISLAESIQAIVTNDAYRMALGIVNYEAASAYPMAMIASIYLDTFYDISNVSAVKNNCSYQVN